MFEAGDKCVAGLLESVYDWPRDVGKESEMTKALEEAFREASKLSEAQQDALAEAIRAEIEAEKGWDKSFANSRDVLERLADEAIADHRAGRTTPLDADRM